MGHESESSKQYAQRRLPLGLDDDIVARYLEYHRTNLKLLHERENR